MRDGPNRIPVFGSRPANRSYRGYATTIRENLRLSRELAWLGICTGRPRWTNMAKLSGLVSCGMTRGLIRRLPNWMQCPVFRALSGNIVFPGFTAPKLLWMARHEQDMFERVSTVLLPKDYLVYWLTGRLVTEMSDAAGTSWLDVGMRNWSEELIDKSGMLSSQMPDLVEGSELVGTLDSKVAAELGLRDNIGVVGGGGDNAAAACGIGAFGEGQGFSVVGHVGGVTRCKRSIRTRSCIGCAHILPCRSGKVVPDGRNPVGN